MAGGRDEEQRYDKANQRKKNSRQPPTSRGGQGDEERRLEENAGAMTRETNVKALPRAASVAGGRDEKAKTNTKWKDGTTHSPARGGSA